MACAITKTTTAGYIQTTHACVCVCVCVYVCVCVCVYTVRVLARSTLIHIAVHVGTVQH